MTFISKFVIYLGQTHRPIRNCFNSFTKLTFRYYEWDELDVTQLCFETPCW